MSDKILTNLRDLERSYGNMRVHNVETIRAGIVEIESLKSLLERSYAELMDVLAHLNAETEFHDGDDFHELMNDIIEKIGYTTPED